MRKKELESSFEELRANVGLNFALLAKKAEQLEQSNKELEKYIESVNDTLSVEFRHLQKAFIFVNRYGKDGIHIDMEFCKWGFRPIVEYLCVNRVFECNFPIDPHSSIGELKVIENEGRSAVFELKVADGELLSSKEKRYYYLDKYKQTCTEIPKPACVLEKELAEQEQSAKKTTSVKKESKKK